MARDDTGAPDPTDGGPGAKAAGWASPAGNAEGGEDSGGSVVYGLADLVSALEAQNRRGVEEAVDEYIELDARIDWADVEETTGITVVVGGRGTTLEYPFAMHELWQTLDELEDEVTADLENEFADAVDEEPETNEDGPDT